MQDEPSDRQRGAQDGMRPAQDGAPRTLEARIFALYASLSPTEKRLADVMLQHQMNFASQTAGSLAAKAGVSAATAARLIRTLGYKTFPEAKRATRAERFWGSPQAGLHDGAGAKADAVSMAAVMEADLDNIRATVAAISPETLAASGRAIASARRLWIMGLRSGFGLAHHAAHYFSLVKSDVQVLPTGGASYSHEFASIERGDVLLVIAFRRRPKLLPTLLREARAAGATTVLITDLSAAASARAAEHVLRCRCFSPSPFNSFAAAVTLINYLAWQVTVLLGPESATRLGRVDRLVELLDNVSTPQGEAHGAKARVGRPSTRSA